MISKEQIEIIAARYGIGVSYREEGEGGFIEDTFGEIRKTLVDDILVSLKNDKHVQKEKISFVIDDDMALFAA